MNGLELLDIYQGEDSDRLALREKMPEPSRVEWPIMRAIKPQKIPYFDINGDFDVPHTIETESFESVWMVTAGGAKFKAWKSCVDGKIYI